MTTLVTGGTGFVGAALIRQLLARGESVRALARPASDTRNLDGLEIERVSGDLADPATLARAVRGCDRLYHVAADYRLWVPDPAAMHRANVDGTVALMRAAAEAGVARIVHTSSVATLGFHRDRSPADEDTPSDLGQMIGPYKQSKFIAEQRVREMVEREGLPAVIVNPSTPIGPRDLKPTPTGQMVLDAISGRMPAFVDTGLNVVHVDDVATGHLLAMEHGRIGRRYILGGENLYLRDILFLLAEIHGHKPPRLRLANGLVLPIAHVAEAWARLSGKPPRLTVTGVKLARKCMFFSSARAERELGYRARPAEQALRAAIEWFETADTSPATRART
ncbi:MAG: hopanoid-associated sugar epimerase [Wenzhouxiangellaceae bacterium]